MTLHGSFVCMCIVLSTACNSASSLQFGGEQPDDKEEFTTISYIKSLCRGTTYAVTDNLTFKATVTGNDLFGELYKTLVVEDDSGGIEIAIDNDKLHLRYPVGAPITVHCQGLYLGDVGGRIELGARPTDIYSVDRLDAQSAALHIHCDAATATPRRAAVLTFRQITLKHVGRYVRFENVRFVDYTTSDAFCDIDPVTLLPIDTERTICDASSSRFVVRTTRGCSYAREMLPIGVGSVNGIVEYFNGVFSLRIINHELFF